MSRCDCRLEQLGGPVESLLTSEFERGHTHLRGPCCHLPRVGVPWPSGIVSGPEIGGEGGIELGRFENLLRQPDAAEIRGVAGGRSGGSSDQRRRHRRDSCRGRGAGVATIITVPACQTRLGVGHLGMPCPWRGAHARSDDEIHSAPQRRLHERPVTHPVGNRSAMCSVEPPQPCGGLVHHPVAKHEPAGIMRPVHLAGHPAEAAHAAHASAPHPHAAHARARCTGPTHRIRASDTTPLLERIDRRTGTQWDHEVRHGVDLPHQALRRFFACRDDEHLVLHEIREVSLFQEQPQSRPEPDAAQSLRDRGGIEIEPRLVERPDVGHDRQVELVGQLADRRTQGCLVEVECLRHRPIERIVDLLLVFRRARKVHRLVLFPHLRDLPPPLGGRVDDGRLGREGNGRDVRFVERIHEAALLVASRALVLGVVVQDAGHEGGCSRHDTGGHRHGVIGPERRCLHRHLLAHAALRLDEYPRRRLGTDDGLRADHLGVILRLGVGDANALLDKGVVSLRELHETILAALQFRVQPHAFAADRGTALVGEVTVDFFAGADDRLPNTRFKLPLQTASRGLVEIRGQPHFFLHRLELISRGIRIADEQLPGVADSHADIALELLRGDTATCGDGFEFRAILGRQSDTGSRQDARVGLDGRIDGACLRERRLADDDRILIVRISAQRRLSEPDRRGGGTDRPRLL